MPPLLMVLTSGLQTANHRLGGDIRSSLAIELDRKHSSSSGKDRYAGRAPFACQQTICWDNIASSDLQPCLLHDQYQYSASVLLQYRRGLFCRPSLLSLK